MPTHYEVLGVDASTSPEDLRRAYVRRARALHPDRHVGVDPDRAAAAARAMQDVNEAWRVLRHPTTRAAYDARLRGPAPSAAPPLRTHPGASPMAHVPDEPVVRIIRGLPWVAAALVLGAIFVFTAFAATGADDGGRSPSSFVGGCVVGSAGSQVQEVDCNRTGAQRVDLIATRASLCGSGSSAIPVGEVWLCTRPADP